MENGVLKGWRGGWINLTYRQTSRQQTAESVRERERDRERQRQRERDRDRETERQRLRIY